MTGNIAYLSDFKEFDGVYVTFEGGAHGGRIFGKGTLKTDSLDFENVYFLNELKFNLFNVSQMYDKKNYVFFTDTECLFLSPNFKLPNESQILLKIPRKDNMYNFDMKNIVPKESLTCLVTKATLDESLLWHRRLGHINFKNINKLVEDNLGSNTELLVSPRFTWVFFLASKDETSEILKNFIKEIENLVDKKVKIIRCDNGTKFKNKFMDDFCREKGNKREYSIASTPQQNGVAKRRNKTLIEATRTMLVDSKLPTTFWAKAVSTACYVQNRVLIVKPHHKTPYELFRNFKPALSFMRPFGCHVTILNTFDNLGKFDGKSDEGFFVGYSLSSRVYNTRTRNVEENLHIGFLENKHIIERNGLKWLFDIDSLTQSITYVPVATCKFLDESAGTQGDLNASTSSGKEAISQDYIVMPIWKDASYFDTPSKDVEDGTHNEDDDKDKSEDDSSLKEVNAAGQHVNTTSLEVNTDCFELNTVDPSLNTAISSDLHSPTDMFKLGASDTLEATHVEFFSDRDAPEVDLGNIPNSYGVPTTLHTRIHKYHPIENVIEPINIAKALSDSSWVEAMQEELFQFKLQQGHRQEECIDYEKVFAFVARIEAIRLFLAYGYYIGFLVYQMDVKSAFLYETIKEEVYVTQPPGFRDPDHPDKVYKVVKALYGLHQAPRAWYETLANYLLSNGFQRGKIDLTLFIKKQRGDILLVQIYVDDIIFGSTNKKLYVKSASTLVDLEKPLVKDGDANDVDISSYIKYIPSLSCKENFKYLKGKPTLGLWYPRYSLFELVAYTDSDYARATKDRKSTIGGCQFLGNRLISWQCKKQTVVATYTTKAEYVADTSCCGQENTSASTLEDGKMQIIATVNGRITTITKASVRRHLKLEDSDGISSLPNTEIFVQLALMGRTYYYANDLPLPRVQSLGCVEGSLTLNEFTLILRVKKLEHKVKTSQHRRRARVVLSDNEEDLEDPFKQGRKIAEIDETLLFHCGEKGEKEISTVIPEVSTTAENLVYIRKSVEKRKDKGKAIMEEDKYVQKKDAEIAKQLQEAIVEAVSAHDINWKDPVVLSYHALQNRSFSKFEQFAKEISEKKDDNSSKPVEGSRKKIVAKKRIDAKLDEESAKRQKLEDVTEEEATTEYEKEKEELRLSLKIIHNDDSEVNHEPLSKKFPIVSWEYQLLKKMEAKDMEVCKLTRANKSSSYHGNIQAFLRRLDRQDLNDLYSLVQERFQDHPFEGHDLLIWGDLRMIFDPDENDELWMNQLDWKLIRWKLHENCRVHTLFMDGALMEINMLVEKNYPLIKELLEKMLNLQLEAEEESTMAFELIKFIKSLLEE
uniref:Integrase catalytic domain-containing protein n=1 Tax=Tanacetum cinerariifolium TaxID=118510 RepID=A0A6L2LTY9_TANCI|nr:hypothetical protein [Tanacetum cinerariifolium]